MSSILDRPDTTARLFLGLPVPAAARERLKGVAQERFGKYFDKFIPDESWHLTLFFFGEVKNHAQYLGYLKQALPQAFVPTVSITNIGRGKARDQLWAYAQPTVALLTLRDALDERLRKIHFPRPVERKKFTPHIRLANFFPVISGMGLADVAAPVACAVQEAYLYKSELTSRGSHYSIEATINLTSQS